MITYPKVQNGPTLAMILKAVICPSLAAFLISIVSLFYSFSKPTFFRPSSGIALVIIRLFSRPLWQVFLCQTWSPWCCDCRATMKFYKRQYRHDNEEARDVAVIATEHRRFDECLPQWQWWNAKSQFQLHRCWYIGKCGVRFISSTRIQAGNNKNRFMNPLGDRKTASLTLLRHPKNKSKCYMSGCDRPTMECGTNSIGATVAAVYL